MGNIEIFKELQYAARAKTPWTTLGNIRTSAPHGLESAELGCVSGPSLLEVSSRLEVSTWVEVSARIPVFHLYFVCLCVVVLCQLVS